MKYKIGIPGWMVGENSFGVTAPYMRFISYFGEPIILDPKGSIRNDLDLIILPGGPDVDTERYNEAPDYYTSKSCQFREYFDKVVLPAYIDQKTPIFGICRGMQSLSVMAGYKLHQHIFHATSDKYKRWELVHKVNIVKNISHCANIESFETNSIHHQAVMNNEEINYGKNNLKLMPIGFSSEKDSERNFIEIVGSIDNPIVGVQWHPEEIYDTFSVQAINYLLKNKESIFILQ